MSLHKYLILFLTLIVSLLAGPGAALSSAPEPKRVLVLNSFSPGYSWTDKMLQGISETFGNSGLTIDSSVRFMDMKRIKRSDEYFKKLHMMLEEGYRNIHFDAVLACDNDALDFIRIYRDRLFPGVPVVFSSINDFDRNMLDGRNDITGTSENTDYLGTINIALTIRPETKNIVVVTDDTTTGQAHRSAIEKLRDLLPKKPGIQFISLGDMTLDELGTTLSRLKEDSIVLLVQHFVDKNGVSHPLSESTPLITSRSAVPVFVLTDSRMGFGALGGHVVSGYHHGAVAAGMVVDLLKGKNISSIPVLLDSPNKYIFDYRVMERFRISEKSLPPERIIINKPDTVPDVYKKYLVLITIATVILASIILWMWRVIKSRKTAEEALRNREEILTLFMKNSPVYVYIKEVTPIGSRVLQASDNFEEMVGIAGSDMMGKLMAELFPAEFAAKIDADDRAVIARGEVLKIDEDLNGRNYTTIKFPLVQGERSLLAGYTIDITERKLAEAALTESESRFRTLMENIPSVAAQGYALDGTVLFWNRASELLYGYSSEEALGANLLDLIIPEEMREGVTGAIQQMIESGEVIPAGELLLKRKDGSRVPVFSSHALLNPSGRPPELFCLDIDLTERKCAEEQRIKLEQQLLHTQKLESLGVLAGGIAHDFNNILMAIMGNADLALMRINKESPAVENLHRIEQASARATDLAKQMLAYSGKGKFVLENIDLNILLEEMLHMLGVSISKKAVLRLNPHQHLPTIEADPTQMRQIIMNLVINASEAIGDKSGVIAITTGCMDCDQSYLKGVWLDENISAGLYVYLEIADTGCGMDKETLGRLFDPFFTTKFTGRGLGMAAVLGIVRGHKGAIKVYSEPTRGTTFKILLPASSRPAEIFNGAGPHNDWKGEGRVLLVDDEETVRGIGAEMLRELGFTVITADDGREGVKQFKQNPDISFIILDLTMPHMDGEQCFRELRQIRPDVKVIMSSGYNEQEVTQKFVGKGLAGFIQKPYKLSTLEDAVRKMG
ncbi:MAG: ABC transporter substrate binding protein [Desulfuromonadales bacterium]